MKYNGLQFCIVYFKLNKVSKLFGGKQALWRNILFFQNKYSLLTLLRNKKAAEVNFSSLNVYVRLKAIVRLFGVK